MLACVCVLAPSSRRLDLGPVGVFEWSREAVVPEVGERLEGTCWVTIDGHLNFHPRSAPPFRSSTWWGGAICPQTSASSTRTAPKP